MSIFSYERVNNENETNTVRCKLIKKWKWYQKILPHLKFILITCSFLFCNFNNNYHTVHSQFMKLPVQKAHMYSDVMSNTYLIPFRLKRLSSFLPPQASISPLSIFNNSPICYFKKSWSVLLLRFSTHCPCFAGAATHVDFRFHYVKMRREHMALNWLDGDCNRSTCGCCYCMLFYYSVNSTCFNIVVRERILRMLPPISPVLCFVAASVEFIEMAELILLILFYISSCPWNERVLLRMQGSNLPNFRSHY